MDEIIYPLAAIASAALLLAIEPICHRLAQWPAIAKTVTILLPGAVWGSQVAICITQDDALWQYDAAVALGWLALAGFYLRRRLFRPLNCQIVTSLLVVGLAMLGNERLRWTLSPAIRVGSLLSLPYCAAVLTFRWGKDTRGLVTRAARMSKRAAGFLGWLCILLATTFGTLCLARWKIEDLGDAFLNAAYFGNVRKVAAMLGAGENPNRQDSYGNNPLALAAHADQVEIAEMLIAHGASLSTKDTQGMTPLLCATYKHNTAVAKVLVAHGASVNVTDKFGWTPLLFAVCGGPPELVELLLDRGADINQRDEYGWQPIHRALRSRSSRAEPLAIVRILLKHGADSNAPGGRAEPDSCIGGWPIQVGFGPSVNPNRGSTPLEIAESNGFTNVVTLLKEHGARKRKQQE